MGISFNKVCHCFGLIMPRTEYYKVALPVSLRDEINKMFDEFPSLKNQYNGNPVEFIRESIRSYIRLMKKESSENIIRSVLVDEQLDKLSKN